MKSEKYIVRMLKDFAGTKTAKIEYAVYDFKSQSLVNEALNSNLLSNIEVRMLKYRSTYDKAVEAVFQVDISTSTITLLALNYLSLSIGEKVENLLTVYEAGDISKKKLLSKIDPEDIEALSKSKIKPGQSTKVLYKAEGLVKGAATGKIVFDRAEVIARASHENLIWVIEDVKSQDIDVIPNVKGLVLANSGPTSHAAIIAKNLEIPTLINYDSNFSETKRKLSGRIVTLDGTSGALYDGALEIVINVWSEEIIKFISFAKSLSKKKLFVNAEKAKDIDSAFERGAQGVGLCRTEHMFFSEESLDLVQKMLFIDNVDNNTLEKLTKIQAKDFESILRVAKNEIVIRLLDAPLHEFAKRGQQYTEKNPMMGYRGIRMLLSKPEIVKLQVKAICKAQRATKFSGQIYIEAPMIINEKEVTLFKELVGKYADPEVFFKFAVMIETPAAMSNVEKIAPLVDHLSFGTNDLTQMYMGLSRDDSNKVVNRYKEKGIWRNNPFRVIEDSLLNNIESACRKAKKSNKELTINICGEQAADPSTIKKLVKIKEIDYISCNVSNLNVAQFSLGKYS